MNKDEKIKEIRKESRERLGKLSKEFVHAKDKETVFAEMEFHRFMIKTCDLCFE